jgi:hypothetical protein
VKSKKRKRPVEGLVVAEFFTKVFISEIFIAETRPEFHIKIIVFETIDYDWG